MHQIHWFHLIFNRPDHGSNLLSLGAVMLASVTSFTANGVAAFFTAGVGLTAIIYNVIKIKIALRKEHDRVHGRKTEDEKDDD